MIGLNKFKTRQANKPSWPFVVNADLAQELGVVGWWPGGPRGGLKLFDQSGKGSHATLANPGGSPTSGWAYGKDGGATLAFSGVNDFCTATNPSALDALPYLTIIAWVEIRAGGLNYGTVCSKYASSNGFLYYAGVSAGGVTPRLYIDGSNVGGTNYITANKFQLIGVTYDQANAYHYLDGVANGSGALANGAINTNAANFEIGANGGIGSEPWTGKLGELVICKKPLTAMQHWDFFEPSSRWALRYQPGLKVYSFTSAAATATSPYHWLFQQGSNSNV